MRRSPQRPSTELSPDGRRRYASGTPWEPRVGYSRALRVGDRVLVSGTTATAPDGRIVGPGDAYRQTVRVLANIDRALRALGSSLDHVVRTRIYVTELADFDAIARAFAARFRRVRPTATLVKVAGLIDPTMRVEIEAEAVDPLPPARPAAARQRARPGRPADPRRPGGSVPRRPA